MDKNAFERPWKRKSKSKKLLPQRSKEDFESCGETKKV